VSATAPGFYAPRVIDYDAQPWMRTTCPDCGAPPDHSCRARAQRAGHWFVCAPHRTRRTPEKLTRPDGWPVAYTANGVLIVPGLRVLDYDRRETTVGVDFMVHNPTWSDGKPVAGSGIAWFRTTTGTFDGSRLLAL
jgi:hypothetical protein